MEEVEITEFHKHELLDRIHAINVMFDQLVVDHKAASLIAADIEATGEALADLYQKAGQIRFPD